MNKYNDWNLFFCKVTLITVDYGLFLGFDLFYFSEIDKYLFNKSVS